MHKLDRSNIPVPQCLLDPPQDFNDLRGAEKEEVRKALFAMQGERCAYCERRTGTGSKEGHVEHFRNQAKHKDLTLDWNNLFWSCNDENTCGKHKDKCDRPIGPQARFDREVIIDPCIDDPERFLIFVYTGNVRPRDGLSVTDHKRAEETLRVFQLDLSPYLRKARADAVGPYVRLMKRSVPNDPDLLAYLQSELNDVSESQFATAIKHFLEGVISP